MEESIWLLAALCSREIYVSLSSFLRAQNGLRKGVSFWSSEFFELCPEFTGWRLKYSNSELSDIRKELLESVERGHLLLYPGHSLFPSSCLQIEEIPFLLRLKGAPIWMGPMGLSVVGHREPSLASLEWMDDHLSQFFRETTCFSVSGGARGVDQKAHLISLRTGRPTVILLPSGLSQIYPASLKDWVDEVVSAGGAILSEYQDQKKMQKHFFAQRNRLISALGCATLIIEARRRSGTLLTAREALDQGKPVWVLPGHPMDPGFLGSLDFLADGGSMVRDATDLCLLFNSEILSSFQSSDNSTKHLV